MLPLIPIPHSSLSLSNFCLGATAFGTGRTQGMTDRLYEIFREAGGNCLDTAHCYSFWLPGGAGSSERALGECIRRHGDQGKVYIITKGGHPAVLPDYPRPDRYLSPEVIASDIADSLERLATERIDLYFLHRDDTRVPVGEILDSLNQHITARRLQAIGASNWSVARIAQANRWAQEHGQNGFVASQMRFGLATPNAPVPVSDPATRYLDDPSLAWHTDTNLPVLAYSPTAGGYFASGGAKGQKSYDNTISRARLARATQLAGELGVNANQIALAYLLRQPFPTIPILGTSDPDHLADALAAAKLRLAPEQTSWLRQG